MVRVFFDQQNVLLPKQNKYHFFTSAKKHNCSSYIQVFPTFEDRRNNWSPFLSAIFPYQAFILLYVFIFQSTTTQVKSYVENKVFPVNAMREIYYIRNYLGFYSNCYQIFTFNTLKCLKDNLYQKTMTNIKICYPV